MISRNREASTNNARNTTQAGGSSEIAQNKTKKPRKVGKLIRIIIIALLLILLAIAGSVGLYLFNTYNSVLGEIQRSDVLSNRADDGTGADVYLIVGSDARSPEAQTDVQGARSDTIMLLIHSAKGTDSLVSIPRDTMIKIPEFADEQGILGKKGEYVDMGFQKVNSAFSYGGPKLLIRTIEEQIDLKIDHYVEVGFDTIRSITNALGGIYLCYDHDVDDWDSDMVWTKGCAWVDGENALAFARMRYSDPLGDIGRAARQHQVVEQLARNAQGELQKGTLLNLFNIPKLAWIADNALKYIMFDKTMDLEHIHNLVTYFQNAASAQTDDADPKDSVLPIKNSEYYDKVLGNVIIVDDDEVQAFFHNKATK
jgi:LCP family protein required for cell wall assembly